MRKAAPPAKLVTCPVDRKRFTPQRRSQKFCSAKCYRADKARRQRRGPQLAPRIVKGERAGINIRFVPPDYALIKKAAANAKESMNLYIITAAVNRAKCAPSRMEKAG